MYTMCAYYTVLFDDDETLLVYGTYDTLFKNMPRYASLSCMIWPNSRGKERFRQKSVRPGSIPFFNLARLSGQCDACGLCRGLNQPYTTRRRPTDRPHRTVEHGHPCSRWEPVSQHRPTVCRGQLSTVAWTTQHRDRTAPYRIGALPPPSSSDVPSSVTEWTTHRETWW